LRQPHRLIAFPAIASARAISDADRIDWVRG